MDVAAWLRELGLERHEPVFRENEIDWEVLPELTEGDLEKLGLPLGPRKQLLKAIARLSNEPIVAPRAAATPPSAIAAEAERRQLTVLFCDLVGSTALSARLDPEEMSDVIGAYHRTCTDTILAQGGFVAKFLGDGVLAYFGYPRASEDDAERAVRAGLNLVAGVSRLTTDGGPMRTRVGIATGRVVVGDLIGEGPAREHAVVGQTPNLAARLQALAAPDQVVVAEATRAMLGGLFEFRDLGEHPFKGFDAPKRVFTVAGEGAPEDRFAGLRTGALTPMVGRDAEIAQLLDLWHSAKGGQGQLVLIGGEPGIGKSRLLRHLRERVARDEHTLWALACAPHLGTTSLAPIASRLRRILGLTASLTPEEQLSTLAAFIRGGALGADAAPLLAALAGISPPAPVHLDPGLTAQQRRERTLETLVHLLEHDARRRPVLILFEDVHWIDPTSLELLGRWIERLRDLPVLAVLTHRPEFEPPWASGPGVTSLILQRLDPASAIAIVECVAGKPLPRGVAELVVGRTDGVPLFVEELTKAVLEGGGLREAPVAWELAGPLLELAVPYTLQDSLMARLDRLAAVKEVAQVGAAVGRVFETDLLAEVSGYPRDLLLEALGRLADAGLIAPTVRGDSYAFKHALMRDAAHDSLLLRRRRELHGRIADALERRGGALPEVLAPHCAEAGRTEAAMGHWLRAGEGSLARSAVSEAARQLHEGLRIAAAEPEGPGRNAWELRLLVPLGAALQAVHGYGAAEVLRAYDRARELCDALPDAPELIPVLRGLYVHYLMRGALRDAHAIAEQLSDLADRVGDEGWRLEARFALGQTLAWHKADFPRAREVLAAGEAIYRIEEHGVHAFTFGQDPGVYCKIIGGWVLWLSGYPDQAVAKLGEGVALADSVGHALSRAAARAFAAQVLQLRGDKEAVRAMADEARAIADEHGLPFFVAWADVNLAWAQVEDGGIRPGAVAMREASDRWLATGGELLMPYFRALLAATLARAGAGAQGLALFPEAFAMAERNGDAFMLAEVRRLEGEVLEVLGRLPEAEGAYVRAVETARAQRARSIELRAATDLARLWAGRGERGPARDLLAPVRDRFTEGFDAPDLRRAAALLEAMR